ncbi:MAG TPA: squalene/phytoene synthase family protein [Candidatus Kapabacteria bacterium]|jgi:phytoene synthase|nr:squalene/phytoene synthase family protein [Candidatus Kapabacteria bacterium]HOV92692.1 squalene/phytoene synthase family protein [Candidatus Kapabacteria bacterium]
MEILTPTHLALYENEPIEKIEGSNFDMSFRVLPKEKRKAITSIYNLLSYLDNIVDKPELTETDAKEKKLDRLARWEETIYNIYDDNKHISPLLAPLRYVIRRFDLPSQYFSTLINGFRRDLTQYRYETFDDLKNYLFEVASVVGLITIEIFGYKYETTKQYAINLGYGLQLTNILRDIKTDKNRGYIYIPQEDLERFDYSEENLINDVYNDNFIELMRFETQRAREYYFKARSYLRPEERKTLLAAGIMDEIYYRLLEKIELKEYNVYQKKIKVNNLHKLSIALKHLINVKFFINRIKKLP